MISDTPDAPYLHYLDAVDFKPVFIVGSHRSGTTILYKMLAETGRLNVTTAYHVINRHRLLQIYLDGLEQESREALCRLFEERGLKDRTFDSVPISPDMPEEYAYALVPQGKQPKLTDASLRSFTEFCRKIQFVQNSGRPVLLKNPFDTANFLYIHARFPEARFVFIHRNPVDVVNSQMKAVLSLLGERNEYVALVYDRYRRISSNPLLMALGRAFYSDALPFLVRQTIQTVVANCEYTAKNADHLGENAMGITYSDLCARPNETMAEVLDFLGLRSDRDFAGFIRTRQPNILPAVEKRRGQIEESTRDYRGRFGV